MLIYLHIAQWLQQVDTTQTADSYDVDDEDEDEDGDANNGSRDGGTNDEDAKGISD